MSKPQTQYLSNRQRNDMIQLTWTNHTGLSLFSFCFANPVIRFRADLGSREEAVWITMSTISPRSISQLDPFSLTHWGGGSILLFSKTAATTASSSFRSSCNTFTPNSDNAFACSEERMAALIRLFWRETLEDAIKSARMEPPLWEMLEYKQERWDEEATCNQQHRWWECSAPCCVISDEWIEIAVMENRCKQCGK